MLTIIPTVCEGYVVSVHRMVRKIVLLTLAASRGVTDLLAKSFVRTKRRTRANDFCETEY